MVGLTLNKYTLIKCHVLDYTMFSTMRHSAEERLAFNYFQLAAVAEQTTCSYNK